MVSITIGTPLARSTLSSSAWAFSTASLLNILARSRMVASATVAGAATSGRCQHDRYCKQPSKICHGVLVLLRVVTLVAHCI